ncbi:MAG: hypothetical protein WCA39_07350 [Nitrososphaeraceae archaeon]
MLLTSVIVIVVVAPTHTTRAVVSPYPQPCEDLVIEIGGGCYTGKEYSAASPSTTLVYVNLY